MASIDVPWTWLSQEVNLCFFLPRKRVFLLHLFALRDCIMRAMGRSPIIVYEGVSIAPLVFTLRSSGNLLNVRHQERVGGITKRSHVMYSSKSLCGMMHKNCSPGRADLHIANKRLVRLHMAIFREVVKLAR
jgi:hypothetical protein